jgi:hypothetical protein
VIYYKDLEQFWVIDKIVSHRIDENGKVFYTIRWKNIKGAKPFEE